MRTLALNQPIVVVDADKKNHKATVIEVLSPTIARVEWNKGNSNAVVAFDADKKPGTFHFADGEEVAAPTPAPAPALNGSK